MEISVDLSRTMNAIFRAPSPIDTPLFNFLQQCPINDVLPNRVAIDKAHDAFRMSNQLSNAADIKFRIVSLNAVNFGQVVAQNDFKGEEWCARGDSNTGPSGS